MSFFISKIIDKKMYYEETGIENPITILYLHGGPGSSCMDFEYQAKNLGKKFHVISCDQIGVLRSDALDEKTDYTMDIQIKVFEELRQSLKIENWYLIGHSYGGTLATKYYLQFPESIKGIIFECPALSVKESTRSNIQWAKNYFESLKNEEIVTECNKLLDNFDSTTLDETTNKMVEIVSKITDENKRNFFHKITMNDYYSLITATNITQDMFQKSGFHAQKIMEDKNFYEDYLSMLNKIKCPVLLCSAKYDPVFGVNQIEIFKEKLPAAKIKNFEESGHFPRIEEKELYTQVVTEFIEKN